MAISGSCHCGDTRFTMDAELPAQLTRCTCTTCSKHGTLYAYCRPDQFRIDDPQTCDAVYRWNTRLVAHHFCPRCGCFTYTDSPDFQSDGTWDGSTRRIGVNARLFDGFDAATAPVFVIDGRNLW